MWTISFSSHFLALNSSVHSATKEIKGMVYRAEENYSLNSSNKDEHYFLNGTLSNAAFCLTFISIWIFRQRCNWKVGWSIIWTSIREVY